MGLQFNGEIDMLRRLSPKDLYKELHRLQFDVLHPQWRSHFRSLVGEAADDKVKDLFGPRSPDVPEVYPEEIFNEILESHENEVLLLNHVLPFVDDPIGVLCLARDSGFKTVVVHESPKDGTFKYESYPEINFFVDRHKYAINRHGQNAGNAALSQVLKRSNAIGWKLISDSCLDIHYSTDSQKLSLVKLELALDLIDHYCNDFPSRFEDLKMELESWYFHPSSRVTVKGCSRWLVLSHEVARTIRA